MRLTVLSTVFAAALAQPLAAQGTGGQSLESAASDPTASLTAFLLQDFYTSDYHNLDGESGNKFQLRLAVPYELGGASNIFRITLPYTTSSPAGTSGLQDATVFNLTTFDQPWGRYGIGFVALLPTGASSQSADRWGLGPAIGFVAQADWGIWGLFNQNIFDMGGDGPRDVNISIIQPIVNYGLGNGWSLGTSDMSIVYDWETDEFVSLPLGLQLNKLVALDAGISVQYGLSYEYNFYDDGFGPKDTFGFTAKFLLP
ncbi:hypothetical protein R5H30_03715 [Sulfitobacter sp. D35]|uniref:hypothetical protein n=1 Tax=Sulfitobacter sp. D35 TaxID=3083252 RepID=UPI00296F923B|nr:hypothetical protein [Sulfitobacter sp. D35]MDW4497077.1 hypothetical protein [Sulfitobacter sp. D35]